MTGFALKFLPLSCFFLFLSASLLAAPLKNQNPGTLDTSFGKDGVVISSIGKGRDRGEIVTHQKDGKILVGGTADVQDASDFALIRYVSDGSIDSSFGKEGRIVVDMGRVDAVFGIAVQNDEKIILSGACGPKGKTDFCLVRILPDGKLDESFGLAGRVTTDLGGQDEIHYMTLQPDGKIIAAGFTVQKKSSDFALARYQTSGELDQDFGTDGKVIMAFSKNDHLYGVALQPDGKIIAAGSIKQGNKDEDCAVIQLNPQGQLDQDFGDKGLAVLRFSPKQDVCSSVLSQPDGKIIAAGFMTRAKGDTDFAIGRLLANGAPDTGFGNQGMTFTHLDDGVDIAHDLLLTKQDRILIGGESEKIMPHRRIRFALARYLSNGQPDVEYGTQGQVILDLGTHEDEIGLSMARASDGKILMAGFVNGNFGLVRLW